MERARTNRYLLFLIEHVLLTVNIEKWTELINSKTKFLLCYVCPLS